MTTLKVTKSQFWNQLIIFSIAFLSILILREYGEQLLIESDITSFKAHTLLKLAVNVILTVMAYVFIKKNNLITLAGLGNTKLKKAGLLVFPLLFLVLLNTLSMDDLSGDNLSITNILLLIIYCISIGFSEELCLRGFLQSHLIRYMGHTKKGVITSVFLAALFFGVVHFLSFDKGLYGEISQAAFATFIGVMFGVLLLITKRIYPLIIIHAIIDFVAKLDTVGISVQKSISNPMSIENSILVALLVLPCLIYGIVLMKKYQLALEQAI